MMRRRERHEGGEDEQVFSSLLLNNGSKWSENVVDDELHFPKLSEGQSRNDHADDIDSLWMVGFLDHAQKTQNEQAEADLSSFLRLPGDCIIPSAAASDILIRQSKATAASAAADADPHSTRSTRHDPKSNMSSEEKRRLDDAGRNFLHGRRKDDNVCRHSRQSRNPQTNRTPYHSVNKKIKRFLGGKMPTERQEDMRSDLLENLFQVNRKEAEAAVILQSAWRRCLSIVRMQELSIQNAYAKRIQAVARGYVTRIRVARYRRRLVRAAIRCQRQFRCRKAWRRWRQNQLIERRAATKCQSIARVWLSKRLLHQLRRIHASTIIQSFWRGWQGRLLRTRLHRYKNAIIIQCWRRVELARRIVVHTRHVKIAAAVNIERWWRGHQSKQLRDELLYERTIETRSNQVRIFSAEEQYWSERLEQLEKRLKSDANVQEWKATLSELPAKEAALEQQIERDEAILIEQRNLRQNLSPRSVEQGWLEQVERNVVSTRKSITSSKLELVFDVRRRIRQAEADLKKRTDEVKEARETRDRWRMWRDEELEELWECQRRHDKEKARRAREQNEADERRRWAVSFTVPSGKPEKDEGRLAEERRRKVVETPAAFCGGAVDSLAAADDRLSEGGGSSSQYQSLKSIVERVKLRSHQNETMQFDAILDPILDKMRNAPPAAIVQSGILSANNGVAASPTRSPEEHIDTKRMLQHPLGGDDEAAPQTTQRPTVAQPRTMPFDLLNQVRGEREQFEREAEAIRNDAKCRWLDGA